MATLSSLRTNIVITRSVAFDQFLYSHQPGSCFVLAAVIAGSPLFECFTRYLDTNMYIALAGKTYYIVHAPVQLCRSSFRVLRDCSLRLCSNCLRANSIHIHTLQSASAGTTGSLEGEAGETTWYDSSICTTQPTNCSVVQVGLYYRYPGQHDQTVCMGM